MRLTDILKPTCVRVPLAAIAKQDAIFELADLLCAQSGIQNRDELKSAIWQREMTRTTGIGHGVAIPHGKSAALGQLNMAIGKPAAPIEYNSIDNKPVDLIILLVSPVDQTSAHIQALASISRLLTDDKFRTTIRRAATADELYKLIVDQEAKSAG